MSQWHAKATCKKTNTWTLVKETSSLKIAEVNDDVETYW